MAVRTGFLLRYLGDADLRSTIQAATNKSGSFNDFVQWLAFGGRQQRHLRAQSDAATRAVAASP